MSKETPENTDVDLRTPEQKRSDERLERLTQELASIESGVTVIISRLQPSWCKGQLEKVTVGEEGLDIEYLIRKWGGHLLQLRIQDANGHLRGSHTVELYSWEPKRKGRVIKDPDAFEDDEQPIQNPAPEPVPQYGSPQLDLFRMFEMMNAQREAELSRMQAILLHQMEQSAPASQHQKPVSSIRDMIALFKAVEEVKGMFGGDGGGGGDEGELPRQVMDIARLFLESKKSQPSAQIVQPQRAPKPMQMPQPNPAAKRIPPKEPPRERESVSPPENVTPIRSNDDLVKQLTELDPIEAADTLANALSSMRPEKQEAAIAVFMSRINETMGDEFEMIEEDIEEGDGKTNVQ